MSAAAGLIAALVGAWLLGAVAERLRLPRVLGELAAGVLIGLAPSGFLKTDGALPLLAELGVLILLFETGLKSDLSHLRRSARDSFAVACAGVAAPFLLGWGAMRALGYPGPSAVFVGAAMTATSVGITARVLFDLGRLDAPESRIILGAAVIDDVLGLGILAWLQAAASSGAVSWGPTARSALIVAAFAAGALVARTPGRARAERALKPAAALLVPLFFVSVGAQVRLGACDPALLVLLSALAAAGKLASGWAARERRVNRWAVGAGMIPRGEVGLVFAQVGLASGAIGPPLYSAVVGMVVLTTFAAPILLKRVFR
ncbi:MAG TPA: cation:proton antiporter [Elusimicrobiota bacterium]|jgi:Kef-type K+ transport system membrane component KefB|nr:cation:proton antiporter [Elusimicrobiota bacterium]